jgi:hypothetical protein
VHERYINRSIFHMCFSKTLVCNSWYIVREINNQNIPWNTSQILLFLIKRNGRHNTSFFLEKGHNTFKFPSVHMVVFLITFMFFLSDELKLLNLCTCLAQTKTVYTINQCFTALEEEPRYECGRGWLLSRILFTPKDRSHRCLIVWSFSFYIRKKKVQ